jgi:hypothetical protein
MEQYTETLTPTKTDTTLLSVKIKSDWYISNFILLLEVIEDTFIFLNNTSTIKANNPQIKKIHTWSSLLVNNRKYSEPIKYFIDSAISGSRAVINSSMKNASQRLRDYSDTVHTNKEFILMEEEVEDFLLNDVKETSLKVLKVEYNSLGEIIVEIPKAIAEQGNDLLNTILFYSKKKKQSELDNEIKGIQVNEKKAEAENKKRLESIIQ